MKRSFGRNFFEIRLFHCLLLSGETSLSVCYPNSYFEVWIENASSAVCLILMILFVRKDSIVLRRF